MAAFSRAKKTWERCQGGEALRAPLGRVGVPPNFGATQNYQGITKWAGHVNTVERIPELSEDENQAIIEQYTLMTQLAFKQDIDIWHNKTRVDNPLLCDEDGPLQLLRPWYDQFYVDVDDVPEAQTKLPEWEWGSDGN